MFYRMELLPGSGTISGSGSAEGDLQQTSMEPGQFPPTSSGGGGGGTWRLVFSTLVTLPIRN